MEGQKNERTERAREGRTVRELVMTALMACLVLVATIAIRIPTPMTQGYVHLGDSMIFLGVMILGKRDGAVAAGLGSALADILGGYASFAPWTFLIKFAMAFVTGIFFDKSAATRKPTGFTVLDIVGMVCGGAVMAGGYFVVEWVMVGNAVTAAAEIPLNIGQFVVGAVIASALSAALRKTSAAKYFARTK